MKKIFTPFNVMLILVALASSLTGIIAFIQPDRIWQIIQQSTLFVVGVMISVRLMIRERIVGIITLVVWIIIGALYIAEWVLT